jgi:acyl-[acyl-carrier-protein]-phospholipid O-acyltransferase / long-chain-fatty-acid--[acyl-carrier-protein] ligase
MTGFFLLAVQSTFFSPAKIGLNKELLGEKHIGMASGLQQAAAMLAILAGQIAAGAIFDERWKSLGGTKEMAWQAALVPLVILTVASVPAIFMGYILPPLKAQSREPFRWSVLVGHFDDLRTLWSDRPLRLGSFGVAFFWGFAAFINLWSLKLARELTQGGEGFGTISSLFMAAASIGMAAGFGAASLLQRRRIQLGWVPISAFLMTLCGLVLCGISFGTADGYKGLLGILEVGEGVSLRQEITFLLMLLCLAFSAALFLAPLNAWMQNRYPADKRGEMQSAVNLQDCLAGVGAVVAIELISRMFAAMGMSGLAAVRCQVTIITVLCLLAAVLSLRHVTAETLRVLVLPVVRIIYRLRVIGQETVPKKGGVLLLPNHVTWADAFFVSAAVHRKVRFVMYDGFMLTKGVGWFARLFDTVPISPGRAKDAVRLVSEALQAGDVVCLFAEGELTRTGCLQEIKRGFELMARRADAPVIPMWIEGAWGSVFSFERGRFFRKIPYKLPYPLTVVLGEPMAAGDATAEGLRSALQRGSAIALEHRSSRLRKRKREQARVWTNGLQLGQIHALPRREDLVLWEHDPMAQELSCIHTGFATIYQNRVLMGGDDVLNGTIRVGGKATREMLREAGTDAASGVFYDFEYEAGAMPPQIVHCRCYAHEGIVVAMSMPDPPPGAGTSHPQYGSREGAVGLLLPGFYPTVADDGLMTIHGPALPEKGLTLPAGSGLDERGFLTIGTREV